MKILTCPRCEIEISLDDEMNIRRLGKSKMCSKCYNKKMFDWNTSNPEKAKINREKSKAKLTPEINRRYNLKALYGITPEQFDEMFSKQNGLCAICNSDGIGKTTRSDSLFVDHCHTTNKVRALLCYGCNLALGAIKENPGTLLAMIEYIIKHKEIEREFRFQHD